MRNLITILFCVCLIVASALASGGHGGYGHGDDGGHGGHPYSFEYGVHDKHTGDKKSHYEHSDGHNVHGEYTIKEADGTTRIVKYHADKKGGFNAVVIREGHAQHPAVYGGGGHGHGGGHGGGHGSGHGGGHGGHGGHGGTSYVGVTHWGAGGHGGHGGGYGGHH